MSMNESNTHLKKLHSLLDEFETESGDVVIGKMIPEFASLIITLSDQLDRAQRKVVNLTWALFGLTVILAFIGAAQLSVSFKLIPEAATQQEKTHKTDTALQELSDKNKLIPNTHTQSFDSKIEKDITRLIQPTPKNGAAD